MILADLLKDVEIVDVQGNINIRVSGIAFNSKEVKPGDVFVCITGFKSDGHKYVEDALERGATAIIAEKNIDTLDVGVPVISMHAPYEAISKLDLYMTYKAFSAFMA